MPLGYDIKEEAKRQSDNSLAAITRRAEARRAAQRRAAAARQPQRAEPLAAMGYAEIRDLAARQDAWAAEHGGVGAAQVRSGDRGVTADNNPNAWLPAAEMLWAVPNYFTDRDPRSEMADVRQTESELRSVGEMLAGPEELVGGLGRVVSGEGSGWDYANLALSALPFSRVGRAVARRIGNSRLGRYLGENVISAADNVVESVPRPSANIGLVVERDISGTGYREQISADAARRALAARGVNIERDQLRTSATEPTLVAELDRALTPQEAFDISQELQQKAIAYVGPRGGSLDGPNAADWGTFSDDYYLPYDEPSGLSIPPRIDVTDPANAFAVGDMSRIQRQLREIELAQRAGDDGAPFLSQLPPEEQLRSDFAVMGGDTLATPAEWASALAVGRRGDPLSPLSVRGEHYSRADDLTQTDPSYYGTGHRGAEYQPTRARGGADRTYFYAQGADGSPITPEVPVATVAPHRYEGDLQNIYDVNADPDQLTALARAHAGLDPATGAPYQPTIPLWMHEGRGVESAGTTTPDLERLIQQYGYSGYISDYAPSWAPQSRRAAAIFDPVPVRRMP